MVLCRESCFRCVIVCIRALAVPPAEVRFFFVHVNVQVHVHVAGGASGARCARSAFEF